MKGKGLRLKSLVAIGVILLLISTSAGDLGAQFCIPAPVGITNWWPGGDNTDDIVGGHDAELRGNAGFDEGLVGEAFVLDGSEGTFVDVPHDSSLDVGDGDFTVELWVNFNSTEGEQILVEKWVQQFEDGAGNPLPSLGWTFTKLEGNVIGFFMEDGQGGAFGTAAGVEIPDNTWIHFAARKRKATATIFVNGVKVASTSGRNGATINVDNTSSLKFGHRGNPDDTPGSQDPRGFFLDGRIDEVSLYVGRALLDPEIRAVYLAGSGGQVQVSWLPKRIGTPL